MTYCTIVTQNVLKFLLGITSANLRTVSDGLTILRVNRTEEKLCVLRKMFCKDVRRN